MKTKLNFFNTYLIGCLKIDLFKVLIMKVSFACQLTRPRVKANSTITKCLKQFAQILIFSLSLIKSPSSLAAPISKLTTQKQSVEKILNSKTTFEKKVKIIVAFKNWADKEVLSSSEKMTEEELTQVMQYSNLLKALKPSQLSLKNCKSSAEKVLDEDLTPMSEKPSAPAQAILIWLKLLCIKGK